MVSDFGVNIIEFVFAIVLLVWVAWGWWNNYKLTQLVTRIEKYLSAIEKRFGSFDDVIEMETPEEDEPYERDTGIGYG